jgi:hypothetical protein
LRSVAPDAGPAVDGKVTITVENVATALALDAVCETLSCRWELRSGKPAVLTVKSVD